MSCGYCKKGTKLPCLACGAPTPWGSACSDLLERSEVIKAIDSEPEYEDAKYFRDDVVGTIKNEFGFGEIESEHLADLLMKSVTTATKDTKQAIRDRVLAL